MSGSLPNKWLITGGCGFIGANLIQSIIASGVSSEHIIVFDNFSGGNPKKITDAFGTGINIIQGDVRVPETLNSVLKGIDIVVHLAASTSVDVSVNDPFLDFDNNANGTLNVLMAARANAVRRVVFASSSAALGESEPPIHENQAARPISPYGASKLTGEAYCSAFSHSFGLETVCLRFANVYGPGAAGSLAVVPSFIASALSGKQLTINGDGSATRDYVYVEDLCEAIVLAATRPVPKGAVYQIASNSETTVKDLLELVGIKVKQMTGQEISFSYGAWRKGDITRSFSDISRAETELGWGPRTPLDKGIEQTISWTIQQMSEPKSVD